MKKLIFITIIYKLDINCVIKVEIYLVVIFIEIVLEIWNFPIFDSKINVCRKPKDSYK